MYKMEFIYKCYVHLKTIRILWILFCITSRQCDDILYSWIHSFDHCWIRSAFMSKNNNLINISGVLAIGKTEKKSRRQLLRETRVVCSTAVATCATVIISHYNDVNDEKSWMKKKKVSINSIGLYIAHCDFLFFRAPYKYSYLLTYLLTCGNVIISTISMLVALPRHVVDTKGIVITWGFVSTTYIFVWVIFAVPSTAVSRHDRNRVI